MVSPSPLCVHALTEALDAGDIYLRHSVEIGPKEDVGRLSLRLETLGADLITKVAVSWLQGGALNATPQSGTVTWAPQLDEDWWEIDWTKTSSEVDRFVRAAHSHPGAYTGIGNELLVIQKAFEVDAEQFSILSPGTPFIREQFVWIRCGEVALAIERVKLGRRQMSGADFAKLLQ